MKRCLQCGRTYSDETFSFCLEDGSLLSAPADPEATLVLPENMKARWASTLTDQPLSESPDAVTKIDERVVTININKEYRPSMSADDLYNVTRSAWKLRRERAERAQYAFAVYRGTILEVYEIDRWVPGGTTSKEFWRERLQRRGDLEHPAQYAGRYEFIGRVGLENIRKKYVGRRMPGRQAQNPIKYFNC
jgi:hypothetical protein